MSSNEKLRLKYSNVLASVRDSYISNRKHAIERSERNLLVRYVIRPISLGITPLFLKAGASANLVSWLGFALGLVAAGLFFSGTRQVQVGAAIIYLVHVILDYVDGNIARFHGTTSHYGKFLDGTLELLAKSTVVLGIGHGVSVGCGSDPSRSFCEFPLLPLTLGALFSIGLLNSAYLSLRYSVAVQEVARVLEKDSGPRELPKANVRSKAGRGLHLIIEMFELPGLLAASVMDLLLPWLVIMAAHHFTLLVSQYIRMLKEGRQTLDGFRAF